jgi:hypothetical protein
MRAGLQDRQGLRVQRSCTMGAPVVRARASSADDLVAASAPLVMVIPPVGTASPSPLGAVGPYALSARSMRMLDGTPLTRVPSKGHGQ